MPKTEREMQIFKIRVLSGKRTVPALAGQVVQLINIVGKRTVELLNPSFKNFIYPWMRWSECYGGSANLKLSARNERQNHP